MLRHRHDCRPPPAPAIMIIVYTLPIRTILTITATISEYYAFPLKLSGSLFLSLNLRCELIIIACCMFRLKFSSGVHSVHKACQITTIGGVYLDSDSLSLTLILATVRLKPFDFGCALLPLTKPEAN